MKKELLWVMVLFFIPNYFFAQQVDETRHFLYLFSDSVIYGEHIDYKKSLFGSSCFIVDSKEIKPEWVKFYNIGNGYFGNTASTGIWDPPKFAIRVDSGKVNLYESSSYHFNVMPVAGFGAIPMVTESVKTYYNISFGDLKRITYKNLILDLKSNPESMEYLQKYKATTKVNTILYIIGGALLVGGTAMFITEPSPPPGEASQMPFSVGVSLTGAACLITSIIISGRKQENLQKAIDAYN